MKTKHLGVLTSLCLTLWAVGLGSSVQAADYTYTTNNGTITITGYTGPGGDVSIPDSITGLPVTTIRERVFSQCTNLISVIIPASITNIGGDSPFIDCPSLTAITVATNNPAYASLDGVLLDKNLTTLLVYPAGRVGGYALPESVTDVSHFAFYNCGDLTQLAIGSKTTNLELGTFTLWGSTSLKTITVDSSNPVYASQDGVLFDKSLSKMLICPAGKVGDYKVPSGVKTIGLAFLMCRSLTSIQISSSVTNIHDSAFYDCLSLEAITVDTNNAAYSSLDGVLFDRNQTQLIRCPARKTGSYAIPSGTMSIGRSAFDPCTRLTSVIIPSSIGIIDFGAFDGCTSLTGAYFEGNAPRCFGEPFTGHTNTTVYYLPGTTEWWGSSFGGRPTALWVRPNPVILSGSAGIQTNQFSFTTSWATNLSVVVEASTTLTNPTWSPVATNTLSSGTNYFSDPQWQAIPARFYRVRSQ